MFSDAMITLAIQDGAALGYAVEIEMPDSWFRAHTGLGDVIIDGHTFSGVGQLGDIDPQSNEGDEKPVSVNCTLNGLNPALVSEALKSKMIGLDARLMLLAFDPETLKLAMAEPAMVGFVSDYTVGLSSDSGSVMVTISDEFELYEMPEHKYWTDGNHAKYHNGDRLCRYVAQMDREIYWGSKVNGAKFIKVI